jgi:hypothetical protein
LPDFSAQVQQQQPTTEVASGGMLGLGGLSSQDSASMVSAYQEQAAADRAAKAADIQAQNAATMGFLQGMGSASGPTTGTMPTSTGRGGYGLSAYGVSQSGAPNQRGTGKAGLQQGFSTALMAAFRDMKAAGLGTPGITDGFRSYAGQVKTKAKWTARGNPGAAATPGRSVHGIGMAADLDLNPAQWRWLVKNGPKYGVHSFPGVTRYGQTEFWHFQGAPSLLKGQLPAAVAAAKKAGPSAGELFAQRFNRPGLSLNQMGLGLGTPTQNRTVRAV